MAVLQIKGFAGAVPMMGDRAIDDNFATHSVNTWLYGQELRGIRPPVTLTTVNNTTRKVLRVPKRTVGGDPAHPGVVPPPSFLGDSTWILFTDIDTDIVKGQLVQDSFERYYFCSPSTGPMFNTYARMQAGQSAYKLGIQGPETTVGGPAMPTIPSITGGTTPVLTRSYLYTWVNEFGEESTPSLPVTSSGNANGVWNIGNITDPVQQTGYPLYTKKYLYRTITGTSGQTTYYRVTPIAGIPLGTTTYADNGATMTDAILALNLTLASTTWSMPPSTLKGWIAMPNGFLIGFDGNTVYMSEAYHWHAWPTEYQQATETPIVGLGVLGSTCVVCTQGFPATVTGVQPSTCSFTKATTGEPCLARGSIVSTPDGVVYASQNGLIIIGPSGIQNATAQLIKRDDWLLSFAPSYLRAVRYQNGYMALRMPPLPDPRSAFFLDPTELNVALTELSDFANIVAMNNDFWSGEVFIIDNTGNVMRWDSPSATQVMPTIWQSKEYQYPFKENFGAYSIYWDANRIGTDPWASDILPLSETVRFTVYADRNVIYDQDVPANGKAVRLPSGFKSDIWQFKITSRAPVYSLQVASTIKELKSV